jgi:hypothetical protein
MSTSTPVADNKMQSAGNPLTAPEERFWKHYSPHHEFPLSTVSSVALHALALILLALAAYYLSDLIKKRNKPLAEEALTFRPSGGGGSRTGEGGGPGVGEDDPQPPEDTGDTKPDNPEQPEKKRPDLVKKGDVPIVPLEEIKDPDMRRLINAGKDTVQAASSLSKETRAKLSKALRKGAGEGGPGRDGGKDKGAGRGEGEGKGELTKREKRVLRWTMIFDTFSGEDYRRQLAALGAFLAIPQPDGQYIVIRELTSSAKGQVEDLETIPNIHWVDNKPDSVAALCHALRIAPIPPHIVAFFPPSLEEKLLRLELRYKGLKEEQIYETRFKIKKIGGGEYEPVVISQTPIR